MSFWISAAGALLGVVTALLVSGGGRRWRLVTTTTPDRAVDATVATEAG
jgi:hypothetical protein